METTVSSFIYLPSLFLFYFSIKAMSIFHMDVNRSRWCDFKLNPNMNPNDPFNMTRYQGTTCTELGYASQFVPLWAGLADK